ncbi:hypothetical protein ABIB17_001461, partial [Arthrobacter sp. UYEF6]
MTWIRLQAAVVGMFTLPAAARTVSAAFPGRDCGLGWVGFVGWVVNVGEPPNLVVGGFSTCNDVPAVTYSPTPSRVQYHRR